MFSSGDGGVGDNNPNPATQQCFTNDGRNTTRFIPSFPASCVYNVVGLLSNQTDAFRNSPGVHCMSIRLLSTQDTDEVPALLLLVELLTYQR